ncbi:hypothetical protein B0A52_05928 [Exophiala mesophila]|uniref:AMP-dependent synthetase/ligase domain-containing protein n=1 Tax=Exophiala mesophila TaxID=212818 RepID=A0A438N3V1_EXOME|nr:hypothetical protein B0A52_05928 [Exophiala mesophila]
MVHKSKFKIQLPETDLLSYLFGTSTSGIEIPDQPIWLDAGNPSRSISKRDALAYIKRFALGLERLGIRQGDVVLMFTPNHIFVPIAYLGTIAHGATFTGAGTTATVSDLAYQISHTEAKLLLYHPEYASVAKAAAKSAGLPESSLYWFSDANNISNETQGWRSILAPADEASKHPLRSFDHSKVHKQPAVINFSSGEQYNGTTERVEDKVPVTLGRSRNGGLASSLYIMHMGNFSASLWLANSDHEITHLQTAPPLLVMLSKRPEVASYDLSSLKDIICGAAPLSRELQNEISTRFNVLIRQTWGGTELTCSATTTPGSMNDDSGSTGVLLPNMECKIIGDDGNEVGVGERGEAYLKGPNVCLGYLKNEEATNNAIIDGFYRTGDVVVCDDRGMFYVVDRMKEILKVNGFQVAPAELEALLLDHEAIADAGVIGVPRSEGEVPLAYVVLKSPFIGRLSNTDIQHWLSSRVAKYKRLEGGVIFIDRIPKSPTGKIQRKELREKYRIQAVASGPRL